MNLLVLIDGDREHKKEAEDDAEDDGEEAENDDAELMNFESIIFRDYDLSPVYGDVIARFYT